MPEAKQLQSNVTTLNPRTTADLIFDQLREEISSLKLLPRSKISEAEIAKRLGVSRQPVRDAFSRLAHHKLLHVRPQRPTIVCGFSIGEIENSRFVRLAVELEVIVQTKKVWNADFSKDLWDNLDRQQTALDEDQRDELHKLDCEFHKLLCDFSGFPLAFNVIENNKQVLDRLCRLSFEKSEAMTTIFDDHRKIAIALDDGTTDDLRELVRVHLSRIDGTIRDIHENHADYFE